MNMGETGLIRYDAMCQAIAEAHRVDEVKDLRDKALALEHYAQQAMNMDAERKACEIRLRAERKAGELLKEQAESGERATRASGVDLGANKHLSSGATSAPTLSDLGISRDQSSKWQKLANVPEQEFEDALRDPETKPSTAGVIRKANGGTEKMDRRARWVWGRLRDFERDRILQMPPADLLGEMTHAMQSDVARLANIVAQYLLDIDRELALLPKVPIKTSEKQLQTHRDAATNAKRAYSRNSGGGNKNAPKQPQRHVVVNGKVYDGPRYADMAIAQLERIEKDDPNRDSAMGRVQDWINPNR